MNTDGCVCVCCVACVHGQETATFGTELRLTEPSRRFVSSSRLAHAPSYSTTLQCWGEKLLIAVVKKSSASLRRLGSGLRPSVCPSVRPSLEGRGHWPLLRQFLGVQGFGEGRGLIRAGGDYCGAVGYGVRCSSGMASRGLHMLPGEQVGFAAG